MQGRRLVVITSVLAVLGCTLGVACSFPEVEFAAPASGEGGGPEGGADASLEVGSDVFVLVDGSDPDALIVQDAGQKIDAAACAPTDCDCDDDGFNNLGKAGCADAGGANDCDDTDTTTRPDQGYNTTKQYPPRNGDWNCKNNVEKFYDPNVKCDGPGGASCDGRFGFEDDPKCGDLGTFVTCKTTGATPPLLPGSCIVASRALNDPTKTQACK